VGWCLYWRMTTLDTDAAVIWRRIEEGMSPSMREAAGRVVAHAPRGAWVVAGAVRDAILGREPTDIDIVVEDDAIDVARAAFDSAHITSHQSFRTASVEIDGMWLDLATARTETYPAPGALPVVAPATIEDDLARRDFSVNAIALPVSGEAALLDPCGGIEDIRRRAVRVLHEHSFQDDATRIYRAFRYAARLGFEIEPETMGWLRRDLRYVETIGGERVRRELELLLLDSPAGAGLESAYAGGAVTAAHPVLSWDARRSAALARAASGGLGGDIDRVAFGFALLAADAMPDGAASAAEGLRLTRAESDAVAGVTALRTTGAMLRRREAKPSGVAVLLDHYPVAAIAAYAATTDDVIAGPLALRYLEEWRHVKPNLNGEDLIELGVPEGPRVGQGLQLLRAARLDGVARDLADEKALAVRFVHSIRDAKAATAPIDLQFDAN
jgi:tRNA nucleotidyltransferase (CCA-adding enzyme)